MNDDGKAWRQTLVVVAVASIVRLGLAALLPLFPDETYYWEWSRHLDGGYFDHPYGVAALVRLGTVLFTLTGAGVSPLAVRFGPVLAGILATVATVRLARRIGGDAAARDAALVVSCLPLAATGLVLATPDAPLLAATAATLFCIARALESPTGSASSLRWWIAGGIALGLAFSSKYTSILIPAAVLIAVVTRRDLRARLREPGPYVACVVATLVFLPVLVWNAHHQWISFLFQIQHGLGTPRGSALGRELEFIGGQAGLASPILFVLMAIASWRALRAREGEAIRRVLAYVAIVTFGFFGYSALRKHVEPNWPAPAYIAAVVLAATTPWSARGRRWLRAGWMFAGGLALIVYLHALVPVLPIPARRDPVAKAFGWDALAARMARTREDAAAAGGAAFVGADRYQDASEISFHLARTTDARSALEPDTRTFAFSVNRSGRANQYDLWPRFPDLARPGDHLVLALDDGDDVHGTAATLAPFFASLERGERVELKRGPDVHGARRIYVLRGWRGGWPPSVLNDK